MTDANPIMSKITLNRPLNKLNSSEKKERLHNVPNTRDTLQI